MGEPACLMSELDADGRIIERPEQIVLTEPVDCGAVEITPSATDPPGVE